MMSQEVFFRLSTPSGLVNVGWKLEGKTFSSNIVCLLCKAHKQLHTNETLPQFFEHLKNDHPETVHHLRLRNFRQMIV